MKEAIKKRVLRFANKRETFRTREIAKLLKVTTSTANIYLLELQLEKKLNRKDIPRKDYNYKIWSIKK